MESLVLKDPKDDKITNKDDSVTNKDGNNNLEKGQQSTNQRKPDENRVPTITPDNDNSDPGPPAEDTTSRNSGQSKENL